MDGWNYVADGPFMWTASIITIPGTLCYIQASTPAQTSRPSAEAWKREK